MLIWEKLVIGMAIVASAFVAGELQGRHAIKEEWKLQTAQTQVKVVTLGAKDQATVDAAGIAFANQVGKVRIITKDRIVKVPVYVTKEDDSRCTVNTGFVSMWNGANSGVPIPADPASGVEAPSGVKLSDVAAQHEIESGYTHELEAQLNQAINILQGLQENHK